MPENQNITRPEDLAHIHNVVFAGGGNRCFWQAGFWESVAEPLKLSPRTLASVSAGSAISCAIFSGKVKETVAAAKSTATQTTTNYQPRNLLRKAPVFPHEQLYRAIIKKTMTTDAIERLRHGPVNRIQLARLPAWLGPKSATVLGLAAYQLEKKLREPVHPRMGRKLGFQSEFREAGHCATADELADLILASSCTPPFTSLSYLGDAPALDGGMVDNVPVHGVDETEGPTLVLLTRPYKVLPEIAGRLYVQPSSKVPVSSWDYTNPKGIQATFDQGRRDGEAFVKTFLH
ncbi:MAG: patatin-like phospholipase family protein [Hahellaceae bacterium]|nr:patatin-like phospholipase family protein [Hahellaceae bacterium]